MRQNVEQCTSIIIMLTDRRVASHTLNHLTVRGAISLMAWSSFMFVGLVYCLIRILHMLGFML